MGESDYAPRRGATRSLWLERGATRGSESSATEDPFALSVSGPLSTSAQVFGNVLWEMMRAPLAPELRVFENLASEGAASVSVKKMDAEPAPKEVLEVSAVSENNDDINLVDVVSMLEISAALAN